MGCSPQSFLYSSPLPRHRSCRAGGNAAIYQQCLTGNVSAGIRSQEDDGALKILWLARALEWNAIAKILDPFLILIHDGILGRLEPAGRKAVHCNAVNPPIIGQTHGELLDTASTRTIRSQPGITCDTRDRTDIDDAAIFFGNHVAGNGL